ncbi:xylulokinase [Curtobacterium sp. PhB42]|uniref:FGGY-family carbohydrate kinase n=1 Tax=unclassified Curtobacterium TaxID=257496 RepID=UPI0010514008|nr:MULTISPECIES: FGGY family carbohydrate kinase [unclassified Curtobacterium]TCU85378.1 xylulokinase [Curtobacterium sp. PhB191]TDW46896.1 xylulokinase [Curtobacterium sp. PhB42]TDW57220.1 xylulokinase [Curtobacterium sp. PhB190]
MRAVLGLDIGTSSTKALLARFDGTVIAEVSRRHDVDRPAQGLVEMDAAVWWDEFTTLTHELLALVPDADVQAVGVSGIGPCVLLTDDAGDPLRPAVLYGIDTRTADLLDEVTAELGGEDTIRARCGSALSTQAAGAKLAWVARHEPDVWERAVRFTMPASRVVELLTGEYVLDHHSASQTTPFYDVHENTWITEWCDRLAPGLPLPRLLWSGDQAGVVTREAAAATGLPVGIPVTAGTIDAWAEGVSVGESVPGRMFLQYGTTMFMIAPTAEPTPVPGMWTTVGTHPGQPSVSGGMATSGAITDWLRRLVDGEWPTMLEEARCAGIGANGLLMLPYFAGERTPIADPDARGVIAGLTVRHTRGDIYRATLEATAYAVRHNIEVLRAAGVEVRELVGAGGGLLGRLWPTIVSDVTGLRQTVPSVTVGASYGSAFLAAALVADVDIRQWNPPATVIEPDPVATAAYEPGYRDYRELYEATKAVVHRLAARS